jgi:polar amino acid transport system substrate-binding protein
MKYTKRLMTMLAVLALALAACSPAADDGGDTTTSAAGDTTTSAAADTTTSAGGDTSTTGDASALPDLEGRTVTVAVENAYLPFNFILAGETEGQGWDYDAWRDICERLNCVPEFVEAAWPAVIDQVAQGEFDTAADGISITDERKEIVDFSEPYMVVHAGGDHELRARRRTGRRGSDPGLRPVRSGHPGAHRRGRGRCDHRRRRRSGVHR